MILCSQLLLLFELKCLSYLHPFQVLQFVSALRSCRRIHLWWLGLLTESICTGTDHGICTENKTGRAQLSLPRGSGESYSIKSFLCYRKPNPFYCLQSNTSVLSSPPSFPAAPSIPRYCSSGGLLALIQWFTIRTCSPNEIKSSILGQVDPYLAIPVSPTLTHTIAVSPTAAGELLLRRLTGQQRALATERLLTGQQRALATENRTYYFGDREKNELLAVSGFLTVENRGTHSQSQLRIHFHQPNLPLNKNGSNKAHQIKEQWVILPTKAEVLNQHAISTLRLGYETKAKGPQGIRSSSERDGRVNFIQLRKGQMRMQLSK